MQINNTTSNSRQYILETTIVDPTLVAHVSKNFWSSWYNSNRICKAFVILYTGEDVKWTGFHNVSVLLI